MKSAEINIQLQKSFVGS